MIRENLWYFVRCSSGEGRENIPRPRQVPACRNETSFRSVFPRFRTNLHLFFFFFFSLRDTARGKVTQRTSEGRDFSVGECASITAQKFIASVDNINEPNSVISERAMMLLNRGLQRKGELGTPCRVSLLAKWQLLRGYSDVETEREHAKRSDSIVNHANWHNGVKNEIFN